MSKSALLPFPWGRFAFSTGTKPRCGLLGLDCSLFQPDLSPHGELPRLTTACGYQPSTSALKASVLNACCCPAPQRHLGQQGRRYRCTLEPLSPPHPACSFSGVNLQAKCLMCSIQNQALRFQRGRLQRLRSSSMWCPTLMVPLTREIYSNSNIILSFWPMCYRLYSSCIQLCNTQTGISHVMRIHKGSYKVL